MLSSFNIFKKVRTKKKEEEVEEKRVEESAVQDKAKVEESLKAEVDSTFIKDVDNNINNEVHNVTEVERFPSQSSSASKCDISDHLSELGGSVSAISDLETPKRESLINWFHLKCPDIMTSRIEKYVDIFVENGIITNTRLGKKIAKNPTALTDIFGVEEDDADEIINSLEKEGLYTRTVISVASVPVSQSKSHTQMPVNVAKSSNVNVSQTFTNTDKETAAGSASSAAMTEEKTNMDSNSISYSNGNSNSSNSTPITITRTSTVFDDLALESYYLPIHAEQYVRMVNINIGNTGGSTSRSHQWGEEVVGLLISILFKGAQTQTQTVWLHGRIVCSSPKNPKFHVVMFNLGQMFHVNIGEQDTIKLELHPSTLAHAMNDMAEPEQKLRGMFYPDVGSLLPATVFKENNVKVDERDLHIRCSTIKHELQSYVVHLQDLGAKISVIEEKEEIERRKVIEKRQAELDRQARQKLQQLEDEEERTREREEEEERERERAGKLKKEKEDEEREKRQQNLKALREREDAEDREREKEREQERIKEGEKEREKEREGEKEKELQNNTKVPEDWDAYTAPPPPPGMSPQKRATMAAGAGASRDISISISPPPPQPNMSPRIRASITMAVAAGLPPPSAPPR